VQLRRSAVRAEGRVLVKNPGTTVAMENHALLKLQEGRAGGNFGRFTYRAGGEREERLFLTKVASALFRQPNIP
jgi:hypothetical protein